MVSYGYFDDKNKEYVITDPKTPIKWINYIGTLNFGGFVDHTGGALLCKGDPALNRINKYIQQVPASDFKGSTLYVRFKTKDGYKVFSPFFVPTLDKYDLYECHVGLGYQKIISEFYGIRTEVTIFVPTNEPVEIRDITVTNKSGQPLEIDVIPVVEYTHFDALKQLTNADWVPQTMTGRLNDKFGFKVLTQYAFMKRDTAVNYLTSNLPISSFETDRRKFLGNNEYGTWASPLALRQKELSNYEADRGNSIGALMQHLGPLKSGESKRLVVLLGQEETIEKAVPLIKKYQDVKNVDAAYKALADFWIKYLALIQVETPDASFNSMINVHNPRQCHVTKNWSRDLSYNQLGFGGRGIGYRDSSQDVLGVMGHMPEDAIALVKKILSVQKPDGSAMHQFYASTMEANEGDSREEKDGHNWYSDDHLWPIYPVTAYIKETGNTKVLDEEITFYDKTKPVEQREKASVLEHLDRAIEFTHSHVGKHGIPLLGFADWNDTVNLKGDAESIFTCCLYGRALLKIIELCEFLKKSDLVQKYKKYYEEMREAFNSAAWDGEWFVRWFEADGSPLGSHKNEGSKMFVNSQSWPLLCGFATPEQGKIALESLRKKLNTKYGVKISWPSYNGFDWRKGGVTTYPPGAKENGGIFLHTNPWVMLAETLLGRGDRAFEYYNQVNPAAKNDSIEVFESAPYNYPQNILGDDHKQFGLGRNSWLSGTASWMYTVSTKYILGVLPVYTGLMVNPCIPKDWPEFKVTRVFRGITYRITVKNPDKVSKGVKKILVDGKEIKGIVIPPQDKDVNVEVILGKDGETDSLSKKYLG
ncbi:cellobiose phosphorylase [Candidatus Termititenax dinenymphae]|uniref:Cellobiose phosphorylase n=1 Tax=Candidatus Termititenax dinenymphae TaxID=2218523 RepID=A0A388TJD8_9BACT|nr:cellobiose phosphorylase [Candidatus Termititenax dinenymphae]